MQNPAYGENGKEYPKYSDMSKSPVIADYGPKREGAKKPRSPFRSPALSATYNRYVGVDPKRQAEFAEAVKEAREKFAVSAPEPDPGPIQIGRYHSSQEADAATSPTVKQPSQVETLEAWLRDNLRRKLEGMDRSGKAEAIPDGMTVVPAVGNATPSVLAAIQAEIEEQRKRFDEGSHFLPMPFDTKTAIHSFDVIQMWIHRTMVEKGFWEEERREGETIALIHSELSELLEGLRKGIATHSDEHCPEYTNEEVELADVIVRCLDYAGRKNLRVGAALVAKMQYNETRPRKHGKQF